VAAAASSPIKTALGWVGYAACPADQEASQPATTSLSGHCLEYVAHLPQVQAGGSFSACQRRRWRTKLALRLTLALCLAVRVSVSLLVLTLTTLVVLVVL
jgi:hypothetical protein